MQGLYAKRLSARDWRGYAGLFLDRDGVLVEEVNYLHRPTDIAFIPGVCEAIARVNAAGFPVMMVTNQAGIGRGLFGWSDFNAVQEAIMAHAATCGAHFDFALACACHAEGTGHYAVPSHPWRKPNPGMLLYAETQWGIDLARSFIIGDCLTDLAAGSAAGLEGGALVETGHGQRDWQANGPAQFSHWMNRSSFTPFRSKNAASAILAWLAMKHDAGSAFAQRITEPV